MAPGASSMLRSRRKDVNVKPNRRLDKKSSRGMLYENEELRMRTITINEEVERGQSDIKKLRRENEQLRREIWGLRDEYDRLEGIIEDLKDETDSEDESEYDDEEEPEVGENAENPENLENAQKEHKATHAHAQQPADPSRGGSFKKEFDGLSVVDEETDDNPSTSINDVTHDPAGRIGWNYGNAAYQPAGVATVPGWQCGVIAQDAAPPCLEGRFFARMPSQIDEAVATLAHEEAENAFCGTITLPNGRKGVYYSDATLPSGGPESNALFSDSEYTSAVLPHWEENAWGPRSTVLSDSESEEQVVKRAPKISFCYSYYGNDGSGLPNVGRSSTQTASIQTVYDTTSPLATDCALLSDCFDKRCGPDLVMSSVYPVDKSTQPVFQNGGNLDQFLEEVNGNLARVELVPEFADGSATEQGEEHALAPNQPHHHGGSVWAAAAVPPRSQGELHEPAAAVAARLAPSEDTSPPLSPVGELPEVTKAVESVYVRTPESRKVLSLPPSDVTASEDQQLTVRAHGGALSPVVSSTDSCSTGGGVSILKRRQSIISTTISVSRQDEEIYGGGQCEAYTKPSSYIRLNSIRPNTLVFASSHADLTVQEVIDALDAQIPTSLSDSVRGVRVVNGNCFICLARREDVGALLDSGFSVRGTPVHLEDVSRGSAIVSLSGIPHHVTDSAVAVIMSNFGTIIGEVERRLYKGVDTGERLLRIKPGTSVSQQLPPTITVAGAQVRITLLPPQDVARLGFVGTRENRANEPTSQSEIERTSRDQYSKYNNNNSRGASTSLDNSYNNDRYKSQLLVHLKSPDTPSGDQDMTKTFAPAPSTEKKTSNAKAPNVKTNPPNFPKVGTSASPAARKYSSVRSPPSYPQPPPVTNGANAQHVYLPDGSVPTNPFTPSQQAQPPPNKLPLHPEQHPQTQQHHMPTQNNPFIPGFSQVGNDHVNPTFNTYTPRNSPTMDRKFSGTINNTFAEVPSNLPTSPLLTRKLLAAHNSGTLQNCPIAGNGMPLPNVPSATVPCVPNSSYLHGNVAASSLQGPPPGSSQPNTNNQNIEQNQSNALKSNRSQSLDNHHLEIPVPPPSSVPNSPLSVRRQRMNRKLSTITRQRSSDEIANNQLSASAPVSRHQTAPNSPNLHRKNTRGGRKLSNHSTSSQNIDNSENERSLPNATSSPLTKQKHGNRKLSVSINEPQTHGNNVVDVSRSSSSGQDSPTKVERRRRVSIYFNNKKSSRRNSAATPNALTRSASLDPTRCRFVNQSLDIGNAEQTTTCSERERTNSVSSKGSSVGGGTRRKSRRSSFRALEGAESGKVPWCGCWGNGCV